MHERAYYIGTMLVGLVARSQRASDEKLAMPFGIVHFICENAPHVNVGAFEFFARFLCVCMTVDASESGQTFGRTITIFIESVQYLRLKSILLLLLLLYLGLQSMRSEEMCGPKCSLLMQMSCMQMRRLCADCNAMHHRRWPREPKLGPLTGPNEPSVLALDRGNDGSAANGVNAHVNTSLGTFCFTLHAQPPRTQCIFAGASRLQARVRMC